MEGVEAEMLFRTSFEFDVVGKSKTITEVDVSILQVVLKEIS